MKMRALRYVVFFILFVALVLIDVFKVEGLNFKLLNPLILCVVLCLYRIALGPTAADRAVAVDILGIVVVGVCALFALFSGRSFFIDIGIAWALQSFIGTIALAKFLEGRRLDE